MLWSTSLNAIAILAPFLVYETIRGIITYLSGRSKRDDLRAMARATLAMERQAAATEALAVAVDGLLQEIRLHRACRRQPGHEEDGDGERLRRVG